MWHAHACRMLTHAHGHAHARLPSFTSTRRQAHAPASTRALMRGPRARSRTHTRVLHAYKLVWHAHTRACLLACAPASTHARASARARLDTHVCARARALWAAHSPIAPRMHTRSRACWASAYACSRTRRWARTRSHTHLLKLAHACTRAARMRTRAPRACLPSHTRACLDTCAPIETRMHTHTVACCACSRASRCARRRARARSHTRVRHARAHARTHAYSTLAHTRAARAPTFPHARLPPRACTPAAARARCRPVRTRARARARLHAHTRLRARALFGLHTRPSRQHAHAHMFVLRAQPRTRACARARSPTRAHAACPRACVRGASVPISRTQGVRGGQKVHDCVLA